MSSPKGIGEPALSGSAGVDVDRVCREAAAAAEAELRPLLDSLRDRPPPLVGGAEAQPSQGWAWLSRGGRSA